MPAEPLDQKVRRMLVARRREWPELARLADVSYSWITTFVRDGIPNPGIRTLEKLQTAMAQKRASKSGARAPAPSTAIPPEA